MKLFREIQSVTNNETTDKISIYFNGDETIIHKIGNKFDELYDEIKNMTKDEIRRHFICKLDDNLNPYSLAC